MPQVVEQQGAGEDRPRASFGPFLAAGYDALKAVRASNTVLGVGLSPRGDDTPGPAGKNGFGGAAPVGPSASSRSTFALSGVVTKSTLLIRTARRSAAASATSRTARRR